MLKSDVIKHYGSVQAAAEAIGVNGSAISQWGEYVPLGRAYQFEKITNGALQVGDRPSEPKKSA